MISNFFESFALFKLIEIIQIDFYKFEIEC